MTHRSRENYRHEPCRVMSVNTWNTTGFIHARRAHYVSTRNVNGCEIEERILLMYTTLHTTTVAGA